ncbi:MAG: SET domain-containing protein-lysine N-methyltransferase [Ferruginibacter sp.]
MQHIINEGIQRYKRKQKKYFVKGNATSGYGIYASRDVSANEIIFKGEEKSQKIVTLNHVEKNWSCEEKEIFRKYAYPVSKNIFLLWDNDPSEWAPQNHSCNPNTGYHGLNVIALRNISKGEELTLDYASFLDEKMEPFQCQCGAEKCRGLITGIKGNTISARENHH